MLLCARSNLGEQSAVKVHADRQARIEALEQVLGRLFISLEDFELVKELVCGMPLSGLQR